jgi:hypothetical protein
MLPRNWDGIANYAVNFTPVPANRPTGDHVAVRPLCRAILQSEITKERESRQRCNSGDGTAAGCVAER